MKLPLPKISKIVLFSLILISISSFSNHYLLAVEETVSDTSTGLRISPPIFELDLEKGLSTQEIIKLENTGTKIQTFYPVVYSFVPKGEEGAEEFILPEKGDDTYSLAKWVNISQDGITLQPREKVAVNFNISVPENAEAGGRYAGILFSTQPDTSDGKQMVEIASQVGPIILGRIAGTTTEQGSIVEFATDKNAYDYLPVEFTTRFKNTGEVHLKPIGKIEIYNIFGKKVDELIFNEKLGNVLPQSIRKFENEWNRSQFTLGKYTAKIVLTYGDKNNYITENTSFWVLPWKEILIGAFVIIITLALLILLIKKYNAWIVKKAIENHVEKQKKEE